MPEVAGLQNNLGLFYHSENHRAKALRSYQSALSTYQSLAVIDPKVYVADVAMVFSNLGDLNREDGRLNEAMLAYQEALATYRTLAKSSPGTYLEDVASVRWHMGWVHSLAGE